MILDEFQPDDSGQVFRRLGDKQRTLCHSIASHRQRSDDNKDWLAMQDRSLCSNEFGQGAVGIQRVSAGVQYCNTRKTHRQPPGKPAVSLVTVRCDA